MEDRELLELAAKAVGMEGMRFASPHMGMVKMIDPTRPDETGSYGPDWNPLINDGDALRLAVNLRIIWGWYDSNSVWARREVGNLVFKESHERKNGIQDEHCATRRAIVRAAAEIGRFL